MEWPAATASAVCKLSDLKPGGGDSDSVSESQLHASPLTRLLRVLVTSISLPVGRFRTYRNPRLVSPVPAFGFGCLLLLASVPPCSSRHS